MGLLLILDLRSNWYLICITMPYSKISILRPQLQNGYAYFLGRTVCTCLIYRHAAISLAFRSLVFLKLSTPNHRLATVGRFFHLTYFFFSHSLHAGSKGPGISPMYVFSNFDRTKYSKRRKNLPWQSLGPVEFAEERFFLAEVIFFLNSGFHLLRKTSNPCLRVIDAPECLWEKRSRPKKI